MERETPPIVCVTTIGVSVLREFSGISHHWHGILPQHSHLDIVICHGQCAVLTRKEINRRKDFPQWKRQLTSVRWGPPSPVSKCIFILLTCSSGGNTKTQSNCQDMAAAAQDYWGLWWLEDSCGRGENLVLTPSVPTAQKSCDKSKYQPGYWHTQTNSSTVYPRFCGLPD